MTQQRPVRVMRIIARLNIGGPAIHVTLLTKQLGPPDFETMLVCGNIGPHEGDMAYLAEQHGIQPVYIPELGRELSPLHDLRTLYKLWRLMRQFRPDVVHTHTAKAGFVGRLAAWLARVPIRVHTYHGHVFHGYFSPAKTRLFLWLERFTARLSDRLITISPALRDELAETYHIAPSTKFEVLPLGLDLEPFATAPRHNGTFRARFDIPAGVPLIGIVGRLVPIKNHELFLAMAEKIRGAVPNAHFVIIGDGENRSKLEAQAQSMGLKSCITFTGWMENLQPAYSDMDVLVNTSHNEGTPVSVIEALAAGVPIVATAVGGVPDLLRQGEYGCLAQPDDLETLAEGVLSALSRTENDGAKLRPEIVAAYDISRLTGDLAALYRRLLATKRKAHTA